MWPFGRARSQTEETDTSKGPLLHCSFCGKTQDQVRKLIAGPTVYICDECIDLCNDIIAEECDQEEALGGTAAPPQPTFGTSIVCPLCRLPRIQTDMLTVVTDRLLCRPCAEATRAALAAEDPSTDT